MSKFSMHVGLGLDFEIEDGEKLDMEKLKDFIRQGIEHLIENGMFTQDSEAVLTNYTFDFDLLVPNEVSEAELDEAIVESEGHSDNCVCQHCIIVDSLNEDDEDEELDLLSDLAELTKQFDQFQHETDQRLLYLEECNRQRE